MQHFIAILEILAWPLTILVIVWVARGPLRSLLRSIQRVKYRGAEVEFSESLQRIEHEISKDTDIKTKTGPSDDGLHSALTLSPDRTVLEAWDALELCAREKAKGLLPTDESFKDPLGRPLDYLEAKGALTPTTARAIRDLRTLRNQVVHIGADSVDRENATRYLGVVEGIMRAIDGISELPRVKLTAITLLILELNSLIDSKQLDDVTVDEAYMWIRNGTIIQSLAERAKGHAHFDHYNADGPYRDFPEFYHERMMQMYNAYSGDHGRKWGVENLGLCLLLAWTNELIQQGSGWYPNET